MIKPYNFTTVNGVNVYLETVLEIRDIGLSKAVRIQMLDGTIKEFGVIKYFLERDYLTNFLPKKAIDTIEGFLYS